ncbi:MAG: N,N-dimethylformamidase beta subunit family domain-containing protein [Actinomycetota bacterium]
MRSTDGDPWFYPDRVTAGVGDVVAIHASGEPAVCSLEVRHPLTDTTLLTIDDVAVDLHPIPEDAAERGCDWPAVASFRIESDWPAGYLDLELRSPSGASTRHFVCLRGPRASRSAGVVVLSTNTYQAYNYWGGANSYADVDALQSGEVTADESRAGAIGRLSARRPYPQGLIAPPADVPRLVNLTDRGVGERAIPGDLDWMIQHRPTAYDGSACYLHKWEDVFLRWAAGAGYELDVVCDHDFEIDDNVLDGYRAAFVVGHSEYWSGRQREQVERFVQHGGKFGVFSGNTSYWKVRWEDDATTMVAHKWRGETDDPLFADPDTRADATHLWSHPAFERPEAELIGLSFLYGGYHRLAMCVARGAGGYTVYRDQHWSLDGADLFYGDTFGTDLPLLGYENDGCPVTFDDQGLPAPDGGVGVPDQLEVIAFAPATTFEPSHSPYPPLIPAEDAETLARIAYGAADPASIARQQRGHAVMASMTLGDGEVFNAGTTEWAHGLAAGDLFVERITRNVLDRFLA